MLFKASGIVLKYCEYIWNSFQYNNYVAANFSVGVASIFFLSFYHISNWKTKIFAELIDLLRSNSTVEWWFLKKDNLDSHPTKNECMQVGMERSHRMTFRCQFGK